MAWTAETEKTLETYANGVRTAKQIGDLMDMTRNQIISKIARMNAAREKTNTLIAEGKITGEKQPIMKLTDGHSASTPAKSRTSFNNSSRSNVPRSKTPKAVYTPVSAAQASPESDSPESDSPTAPRSLTVFEKFARMSFRQPGEHVAEDKECLWSVDSVEGGKCGAARHTRKSTYCMVHHAVSAPGSTRTALYNQYPGMKETVAAFTNALMASEAPQPQKTDAAVPNTGQTAKTSQYIPA